MEIIRCPFCSFELAGDKQLIGRRVQCYRCREKFSVEESMLSETENNSSLTSCDTPPPKSIVLVLDDIPSEESGPGIPENEQPDAVVEENAVTDSPVESSPDAEAVATVSCPAKRSLSITRILLEIAILGVMFFLTFFTDRGQLGYIFLGLLLLAFIGLLLQNKLSGSSGTPQNDGVIVLSDGTKVRQCKNNPKIYTDLNSGRKFVRNGNDFLEM